MRKLSVCCSDKKKWQDSSNEWVTWWSQFVCRGLPALYKILIILPSHVTNKHRQQDW